MLFCGALAIRKGVHYLLQAFTELGLPGAELWLVGPVSEELASVVARYQSPAVIVHGAKRQSQLPWYYGQADVFCLPSLEEGMAMVLLQAMACALPVVCTTNTGGADVIRDGADGFVVPVRDVQALKERIVWCYEHREECRAMGRAARARVGSGFRWDDYGERAAGAYSQMVAAGTN